MHVYVIPGHHIDFCETRERIGSCHPPLHTHIISIVLGVLSVAYFIVYVYYNARARMRLEKPPYNRFRTGNLLQNWQVSLLIGVLRWSRVLLQYIPYSRVCT